MQKLMLVCRVCGKKYEACSCINLLGAFHWRSVACSVECASEYFRQVEEARSAPNQSAPADISADSAEG